MITNKSTDSSGKFSPRGFNHLIVLAIKACLVLDEGQKMSK